MSILRSNRSLASTGLVLVVTVAGLSAHWSQMAAAKPMRTSPAGSYTMTYWIPKGPVPNPYLNRPGFHRDSLVWEPTGSVVLL
jgi:hypothetical protein